MTAESAASERVVYRIYRSEGSSLKAWLWALGGVALVAVSVMGFLIAVFARVGQPNMHLMATLPAILAVTAFAKAWTARKTPAIVKVGAPHLVILRGNEQQILPWEDIGWSCVDDAPLNHSRRLRLFDTGGKHIIDLADSFTDFKDLTERVQTELAHRASPAAESIRLRKAKRAALILVGSVALLLPLSIVNIWLAYSNQRAKTLFATSAVDGEAKIVERFIAPNGVTRRLEYEVTSNGTSATRNAEVTPEYWDSLADQTSVPVRYVPDEPAISKLVTGEVEQDDISENPLVMYAISAALGIFCLVAIALAVLKWKGWDLNFDSKTFKLSLKPFGAAK